MARQKYVCFRDVSLEMLGESTFPKGGQIIDATGIRGNMLLVFPEGITHSVIVEQLQKVYPGLVPVSAGFVSLTEDGFVTYGKSESLHLTSRPYDADIFDEELNASLESLDTERQ